MSSLFRVALYSVVLGCACATGPSAEPATVDEVCAERSREVGMLVERARAESLCSTDADCALFYPKVNCFWTCGVAVRAAAVDSWMEFFRKAEVEICEADGIQCTNREPLPPCVLHTVACLQGFCTLH